MTTIQENVLMYLLNTIGTLNLGSELQIHKPADVYCIMIHSMDTIICKH